LRAEIIWHKLNGLPESVTDRVRRNHEQWFHFTREGSYFSGLDEIREPHAASYVKWMNAKPEDGWPRGKLNDDRADGGVINPAGLNSLGKLPGSVWSMAMEPLRVPDWLGVDHFAAFPTEWPRKLISGWSPSGFCIECDEPRTPVSISKRDENYGTNTAKHDGRDWSSSSNHRKDRVYKTTTEITGYACACDDAKAPTRPAVVLDPFGGTGTVAMVARALGREALHVDLSTDYLKLAKWRVFESGQWAKAVRRTNEDNQQTLDL
jgi:hypothetical protein